MSTLQGKTLFITGASRGIGLAIALRAARDGANVVHRRQDGRAPPEAAGHHLQRRRGDRGGRRQGAAAAVRHPRRGRRCCAAVAQTVERFGGIDILVNNASAISLHADADTPMKRFDLMFGVNVRGTFCCSQACLPHLSSAPGRAQPAHPEPVAAAVA